ncbi:MAG: BspA family leucine-rich repeat surface protein, partial [Bacteroidota bacterium]
GSFSGLGAWDVGNVEDMSNMFAGVTDFNQDISAWNVGKVEDMSGMFVSTLGFNQNLGAWDVSQVEDMSAMFEGAQAFDQDLGSWNVGQVQDMSQMFTNTALSTANYDALLMGWSAQTLQAGVVFDAGNSRYCLGGTARAVLVAAPNNWTITDAGVAPDCVPEANCQNVTIQLDTEGVETVQAVTVNNNSTSIAPPLTFTLSPSTFSCADLGENPVVLTVTDGNGNSSSCTAIITVIDDNGPTFLSCTESTTREINLPALSYVVPGSELDPTAEDNCGVVSLSNNINGAATLAGAELLPGTHEIIWTASDNSGHTTICTTQVTVEYSATDYFITTWQTTSPNESITIPTIGAGYDYTVDWGDGTTTTNHTGDATHTYATPGVHTVRLVGNFPRIFFLASTSRTKILTIEQWGRIQWTSMASAFNGCTNLNITNPDIDSPDLSAVSDLSAMFSLAENFDGPISTWDVSNVRDMSGMFLFASAFNHPLNDWDVGQVEEMDGMFFGATNFNQPLDNWDVGNVRRMNSMFGRAVAFNQPLGNWDVGNVERMQGMFSSAESFNQPLDNWDVGNVRGMQSMFDAAIAFDQDLGSWNVGQVEAMDGMFQGVALSTANYDALLMGWSTQALQAGVIFDAGDSHYCAGRSARAVLTASPNNWTITDADLDADCSEVELQLKVFLQGPFDEASGSMKDDLRAAGVIPTMEPYTAMAGFTHLNGGGETVAASVLNVTDGDAVVDWVLVELRDANDPSIVLHTRAALLQRDGDVVDVAGGSTPVFFPRAAPGAYHVVVRHRNHLGIRTAAPLMVGANTAYDFTTAAGQAFGTEPMVLLNGRWAMWAGNTKSDNNYVRLTPRVFPPPSLDSDRTFILDHFLGGDPNATLAGYSNGDVNMDGFVRLTPRVFPPPSLRSDATFILDEVLNGDPNATRTEQFTP